MPERLESAAVSWKVYNPPGARYRPTNQYAILVSDNIFLSFARYRDPTSPLYKKAFLPLFPADFTHDVMTDSLPHVSWLMPPSGYDEHPPSAPALGMAYTHQVIDILVSNPKVWARTVLFVMYDENDGFFDHVPPPTPPSGTPDEYLTLDPLPTEAVGVAGPIGLGFRVPMLVVSPFSVGGYICSDTFDHTSQLRFLEQRFGVSAPNISTWRRRVAGDLTSTLQLHAPRTAVPTLPPTAGVDDPAVRSQCSAAQVRGSIEPVAPYALPSVQVMPTQETGSRRRVGSTST
jgi:phospholipase C